MLKLTDLASRADFQLGPLRVSPARRLVEGPAGGVNVEPIVLKVFLLLLDAGGNVVTRDELFGNAWGGVFVGDDSLNRAIARVRKIAAEAAPGLFEIETIPRTGYRVTGEILQYLNARDEPPTRPSDTRVNRRVMIGGAAAAATFAGAGLWWLHRPRADARFDALVRSVEQAVHTETPDEQSIRNLREAVSLRPGNARAWGLLAFLTSVQTESADPKTAQSAMKESQAAARRALGLDGNEPYALLAMFELQGSTLDWAARDRRLRQIIAIDPTNIPAIAELVLLTQAVGLNRESWKWNERAIALDPLSFDFLSKRALKLWIAGRTAQADKVIDQVMALYPDNPWSWFVRLLIYATTGRPHAALVMLDEKPNNLGDPAATSLWRTTLLALNTPSARNVAKARSACLAAAEASGSFAADTVMLLSALGEVNAAFDVAYGFLLSRGALVTKRQIRARDNLNDATWRVNTQYLFTPPCRIMRADRRFLPLCEGLGLTDYWRARGVRPDYQLTET